MDGILVGYGCKKYASSYNCPISELKRVRPNQYELFADDLTENAKQLIQMRMWHAGFAAEFDLPDRAS